MSFRVIEDSDDDEASIASQSPDKASAIPASGLSRTSPSTTTPASIQHATSSTDLVMFQSVYDGTFIARSVPSGELHSSQEFPSFTQLISHAAAPRMSSSPVRDTTSQSKNPNSLPMTSITEPSKSKQNMKRAKSMRDMDDLTQVATPRASKDAADEDPWAYPSSSPADETSGPKVVKSRNALRESAKKTYGKTLKRSKTMTDAVAGHFSDFVGPESSREEPSSHKLHHQLPNGTGNGERLPSSPPVKVRQPGLSANADVVNRISENPTTTQGKISSTNVLNLVSSSTEPASVQIPGSTSGDASHPSHQTSTGSVVVNSVPLSSGEKQHTVHPERVRDSNAVEGSTRKAAISVVLPSTLTDSQKEQYNPVSTGSSTRDCRGSLASSVEVDDTTNTPTECLKKAPKHRAYQSSIEDTTSASKKHQSSPSLPLPSPSHKLKRARSEVTPEMPISSTTPTSSKKRQQLKRNKTMESDHHTHNSQGSVDELSLIPTSSIGRSMIEVVSTQGSKRKRSRATEDERITMDELFGSDDVGLPMERYEPRPSRRRSKSMSVQEPDKDAVEFAKPKAKRAKSMKHSMNSSISIDCGPDPDIVLPPRGNADLVESSISTLIPTDELFPSTNTHIEAAAKAMPMKSILKSAKGSELVVEQDESFLAKEAPSDVVHGGMEQTIPSLNMALEEDVDEEDVVPIKSKRGRKKSILHASKTTSITDQSGKTALETSEISLTHDDNATVENTTTGLSKGTNDEGTLEGEEESSVKSNNVLVSKSANVPESTPTSNGSTPAPQKKKRGRPPGRRKTAPVIASPRIVEEIIETEPSEPLIIPEKAKKAEPKKPGQRKVTPVNDSTPKETSPPSEATAKANASEAQEPAQTPSWNRTADCLKPKTTPPKESTKNDSVLRTPSKVVKGADQHSPLQSAKVPYRVGLSKRNRIAPLLKIIRK